MDKKDVLIVKTLGGFSMSWNGRVVGGGAKSRDSQFTRLMQSLIHYRDQGIERDQLERLLFEESSSEDLRHMFRSVMYNSKRKLVSCGMPDTEFFRIRDGRLYWTDEIEVQEDASEFEKMYEAAVNCDDADRCKLMEHAALFYGGAFLPDQKSMVWVAGEDQRYRQMFTECMRGAVRMLLDEGNYAGAEALGIHASEVDPLAEWEFVTMEALISQEKYDEARTLYECTVDRYMNELGVRSSSRAAEMLDRLSSRMNYKYALIDEIQADLSGAEDAGSGDYFSYPVFRGIYRMVERMIGRTGQSAFLMLCTVVDGKGQPMREGAVLNRLSEQLGQAILHSVRHSDVICRYGKGQFLILLINTTAENCGLIEDRISRMFGSDGQRNKINYSTSVITSDQFI